MSAGYSQTPLAKKLGIKEGFKIKVIDAPSYYFDLFEILPEVTLATEGATNLAFVHFFCTKKQALIDQFPKLKMLIAPDGMIWVSWPKKTSNVPTDVDGTLVRNVGLHNGLVDVKVCALDDIWSGHKFVYRKEDRK